MRSTCKERLYLSTIAEDAPAMAKTYGLGLEIADFCTAMYIDQDFPHWDGIVQEKIRGSARRVFHAPFNELATAAIDPLVLEITYRRYRQAIELAQRYGCKKVVFHSTFIPRVYYPEWFIPRSVEFWQTFLKDVPEDICCCMENVMDTQMEPLVDIVSNVNDSRLRLCLDIGHIHVTQTEKTVETVVEDIAPWIAHAHIHNNNGLHDTHSQLGDGRIPVERVLELLLEKTDATLGMETLCCEPSLKWLREREFL